jgi:hypothetical protein
MNWGIAKIATEKEKIKSEFADFLHGLNSCCDIDYNAYSQIFDYAMELFDQMYEQGKKDAKVEE